MAIARRTTSRPVGLGLASSVLVHGLVFAGAFLRLARWDPSSAIEIEVSAAGGQMVLAPGERSVDRQRSSAGREGHEPRTRSHRLKIAKPLPEATRARVADPPPEVAESAPATSLDAGAPQVDMRPYGPEGSWLTLLIRSDRLKQTTFAAAVDMTLLRSVDRRELLAGTGLNFLNTFDELLLAKTGSREAASTVLIARHHLDSVELKAALDRGAAFNRRAIAWHLEAERLVGRRGADATASSPPAERLIVLPTPDLAVVLPAGHSLLRASAAGAHTAEPAIAAGTEGGADAGADDDTGETASWRALTARLQAEDDLLPPDAAMMLVAVDGATPGASSEGNTSIGAALLGGEVPPHVVTIVLGTDARLEITAEFREEGDAQRWYDGWPLVHGELGRTDLSESVAPFVAGATPAREGKLVRLQKPLTQEQTLRLLEVGARILGV